MKASVRLYPVDVALRSLQPVGDAGVRQRVLTADASGVVVTRMLEIPAGADSTLPADSALWREIYVLEGELYGGELSFGAGAFLARDSGTELPPLMARRDSVLVEFQETRRPGGDKPEVTLDTEAAAALPWFRPAGSPDGLVHKVLSESPTGSMTRVLRVAPFIATGVFVHDHSEEVLMLQGSYKMGEEFHPAGTFTAKGPGVPHGPFSTHEGYVGLEVRNYA